ncbi:hypothetical protein [Halobacteriovorax marinus]|uniref:hypothetical protein n=1 Tax=Halobacteriovorax marinus TaxID=97084 RepID=UPI0012FE495D|nr:hypothetical protein [Halobacteriovorax marinus]
MNLKKQNITKYCIWAAIFLSLALSISSYKLIPFENPDGLDFQNMYAYSVCDKELEQKFNNNIYLAGGLDCGDAMGRAFVYPPLLFYSTYWVGSFKSFESARLTWRVFIVIGLIVSLFLWSSNIRNFLFCVPFVLLLFLQFPLLFALERGNNDILVVILWSLAFYFYKKENFFLTGALAVSCVFMKVYPLFAFGVISIGFLVDFIKYEKREVLRYLWGVIISSTIILLAFRELWFSWLLRVSQFSGRTMTASHLNHSMQYLFDLNVIGKLLFLILVALWGAHFIYANRENRITSFAGALALTTYFSPVSYDYNLITTYPLFYVLTERLIKKFDIKTGAVLLLLLVGIALHRGLFFWGDLSGFKFHLFLQVLALILIAMNDLPLWKVKHYYQYLKSKWELL